MVATTTHEPSNSPGRRRAVLNSTGLYSARMTLKSSSVCLASSIRSTINSTRSALRVSRKRRMSAAQSSVLPVPVAISRRNLRKAWLSNSRAMVLDRKSVGEGKRGDLGGRRINEKKNRQKEQKGLVHQESGELNTVGGHPLQVA